MCRDIDRTRASVPASQQHGAYIVLVPFDPDREYIDPDHEAWDRRQEEERIRLGE